MEKIQIESLEFDISRFSFGTASLLNIGSVKKQIDHIKYATKLGFTHFDTSPYYGFGIAEKVLGEALKNNTKTTIASKIGIYPPKLLLKQSNIYEIIIRKAGGRIFHSLTQPKIDFSLSIASSSITRSLKNLNRNYLDILFIHEPDFDMINVDQLADWMDSEKYRVRHFGFAGEVEKIKKFLNLFPSSKYIYQGPFTNDINKNSFISITYGHYRNILSHNIDLSEALSNQSDNNSYLVYSSKRKRLETLSQIEDNL